MTMDEWQINLLSDYRRQIESMASDLHYEREANKDDFEALCDAMTLIIDHIIKVNE